MNATNPIDPKSNPPMRLALLKTGTVSSELISRHVEGRLPPWRAEVRRRRDQGGECFNTERISDLVLKIENRESKIENLPERLGLTLLALQCHDSLPQPGTRRQGGFATFQNEKP